MNVFSSKGNSTIEVILLIFIGVYKFQDIFWMILKERGEWIVVKIIIIFFYYILSISCYKNEKDNLFFMKIYIRNVFASFSPILKHGPRSLSMMRILWWIKTITV